MGNIIDAYKEGISENKNTMLENYKDLVVTAEEVRQASEKVVKEYESTAEVTGIRCNRLVGYILAPNVVTWSILLLNGDVIYESGKYVKNDAWIKELSEVGLEEGTQFKVRAARDDAPDTCDNIFVYTADSNTTAYLKFYENPNQRTITACLGIVPLYYAPNAEPYLYSTGISVSNQSGVLARYALYTLDGKKIYERGDFPQDTVWTTSFEAIGIEPGTVFYLKVIVVAGEDSVADVVMKYVPDSLYRADFYLSGITTKNLVSFNGVSNFDPVVVIKEASSVVLYNLAGAIVNWKIIRLDGVELFTSDNQLQYETWKYDLEALSLEVGTQLRVKAFVTGRKDRYGPEIIEYTPSSATIYYEYIIGKIDYFRCDGVVPSVEKPPVLKCSSIAAKHDEYAVIMRWQLLYAATGSLLHESSRCPRGDTWRYSLSSLNVAPGTRLKLKASVTAGADSVAYIILEYDPTSEEVASFGFYGNAFRTITPLKEQFI